MSMCRETHIGLHLLVSRVMGDLRSTEEESQTWTKLCEVSVDSRLVVLLYGSHSHLSTLYVSPLCKVTCVILPTGAGRQPSSPENVLSKKQARKEEEKLTTELQLITQERNEVNDRLISITEEAMNKRYALLQTQWCRSGVSNVTSILPF